MRAGEGGHQAGEAGGQAGGDTPQSAVINYISNVAMGLVRAAINLSLNSIKNDVLPVGKRCGILSIGRGG